MIDNCEQDYVGRWLKASFNWIKDQAVGISTPYYYIFFR